MARDNLQQERAAKTAALKQKWAQEKEERTTEQQRRREAGLKATRDELQMIAEKRKLNKEKERQLAAEAVQRRNEQLKGQNDDRAQLARDLREKELRRRRESAELNQKTAREAHEKELEMERQKRDEEKSLLESRRIAFLETRSAVKELESSRRQSLVNRGLTSAKQRDVTKKLKEDKLQEERDVLEFRREAFVDKKEFEKSIQENRRRSLVGRLDQWRNEKQLEESTKKREIETMHAEAEVKTQDWLDLQEYKKALAQKERESLEQRIQKWREERTLESEAKAQQAEQEQIERELFLQECEDVILYREQLEASRRQSLAYRLAVGRRDRDWEEGVEANQAAIQMQERQIIATDREDINQHRQQLDENRRMSLAFRLQQHVSHRLVALGYI